MCQICANFTPYVPGCTYDGLAAGATTASGTAGAAPPLAGTVTEDGDAAANIGTTAMVELDHVFNGALASASDSDWIEITLQAGTYTIGGVGTGALGFALNDMYLRLRDDAGALVASDDDGGPGRNSDITVTVSSAATYFIDVQSWNGSDAGTYGVSVVAGDVASYDAQMAAGNLMRPNQGWTTTPNDGVTPLSWGVRATGQAYSDGSAPLQVLSAPQVQMVQSAMGYIEGVTNIDFDHVNAGGTTDNATILFGGYSANDGAGAFAYYPGSAPGQTAASSRAGDVWLNNSGGFGAGADLGAGGFAYFATLHEVGHALGLAHPGDYNAGAGTSITYGNQAQYRQDSHQYTVMSYFNETYTGASGGLRFPDTFMLHDYLALHQLYGADADYHGGNSTYGFNVSGAGVDATVYDFGLNTTPFMTIYDGSGTDAIDLSGYAMDNALTLKQGDFSDIGGFSANLSIAFGAVIENAYGGSGNDTLTGNAAANLLVGRNGDDRIIGDGGADRLIGGGGSDTLNGGLGADIVIGGDGADRLLGQAGHDRLDGGSGTDTLWGGAGDDTIEGGFGDDILQGSDGNDRLIGQSGNDRLIGGAQKDVLSGGSGGDTLLGGFGSDTLIGGSGEDRLIGQAGNDRLLGGTQSDLLSGGSGQDTMIGGAGFDTLIGGTGHDHLYGKFNADRFVFGDGHGNDTIFDFDANNDHEKLDLSGVSGLDSLDAVIGNGSGTQAARQQGAHVQIETGTDTSITLLNVNLDDLDELDFVF